ncbi:MAG: enolase C-terminal domain-like protein [Pseudomonadota bacterium]
MKISGVQLTRISVPFQHRFSHAKASRQAGDAIIICVITESGHRGFGEIQARTYVTGEDNEPIWRQYAGDLAKRLQGLSLNSCDDIRQAMAEVGDYQIQPALTGGFDIALHDALECYKGLDWRQIFGPKRKRPSAPCLTIGDDHDERGLIRQGRFARLSGCTAVKLKVGGHDDVARIQLLRKTIGKDIDLRLDGNGELDFNTADALLRASRDCAIHSIEEPLSKHQPELIEQLRALHTSTGVALMADESICTEYDLERFIDTGAYQWINVRVGKAGGVSGASRLLRRALDHSFGIVCGTMVGETAVLLRISRKLLHHCDPLAYVEGLQQGSSLLKHEPLREVSDADLAHFEWQHDQLSQCVVSQQSIGA